MKGPRLFTERAHLMCPGMNFGIMVTLHSGYDFTKVRQTVQALETAHPFLRAVIGYEAADNEYFYDIQEHGMTEVTERVPAADSPDRPFWLNDFAAINRHETDVLREGLLKVIAYRGTDSTVLLFVFHHLLMDGRGALSLVQEFTGLYAGNVLPRSTGEKLIESIRDLPEGSGLKGISARIVRFSNRRWRKENTRLTYPEYHAFADRYAKEHPVDYQRSILDARALTEQIREHVRDSISVNDYLLAKMFLEESTRKIIIAQDIRDRLPFYRKGAMGNYSTAFSIECRPKSADIWAAACQVHEQVQKKINSPGESMQVLACYSAMEPGLLDAAAMTALGGFNSKTALFVGDRMFGYKSGSGCSVTNLGKIENTSIAAAAFIPPASPAMRRTLGVLTVNGEMQICVSQRVRK